MASRLPVVSVRVGQHTCEALVDTGCTDSLVYRAVCSQWSDSAVQLTAVNGSTLQCCGETELWVTVQGMRRKLRALVVEERPLGMEMILGMDSVQALGGVRVYSPTAVEFGGYVACSVTVSDEPAVCGNVGGD